MRATAHIAIFGKEGNKVGLQEIAEALHIPRHFLGKIMQDLVRHGILDSTKGPNGGFFVHAGTFDMPLVAILKITDGNLIFDQCALGIKRCNAQYPCPLHHDFAICRDDMIRVLSEKTVGLLVEEVVAGKSFLVR